ncbi:MAG: flavin reductase family protein [Halobacteria archaeon]|nr:flavin reductase family protein [Halobacteria archaeon]
MILDLSELKPAQVYFQMIQTLVPRPIAWVLSEIEENKYNLAPFSYFNAVCSDPPLIMLSVGKKPDGSYKDTRVNIEQRRDFVVHIAHRDVLQDLNRSSATLDADISELDQLSIETTELEGSRLPRIKACRIAYACECYEIHELGSTPQSIIYGRVHHIYIDDAITSTNDKGRLKVHAHRLEPIARLGADEYMSFGEVISLGRPK